MGGNKGSTKSGGFFHLFDWNRKSRKKLFSVSPESTKHEKKDEDKLARTRFGLADDDVTTPKSSGKGSCDYSCASSVTDEDGISHRAPGVVAKLMGLDSMPVSYGSEPSSTPFVDTHSLCRSQISNKNPKNYISHQFSHICNISDGHIRRPVDMRSQKMPSSPIERFQNETLPKRSNKSIPLSHHKLLSPVKNPGFISAKNAAYIMEAASKSLNSENHPNSRTRASSLGSSSASIRTSNFLDSTKTHNDEVVFKHFGRQHLNKSGICPENTTDPSTRDVKGKGKSISLAVQAKANVQKRESLYSSSRNSLTQKGHSDSNQCLNSQPNYHKNKQQKKAGANNSSGALRQNNQKQNCMASKSKVSSKQLMSNHGNKHIIADTSSAKNKPSNKFSVASRVDFDSEGSSSTYKDFPQKKRFIEKGFVCEKSRFADDLLVNRNKKHFQPNVVIDEHSKFTWKDNDSISDGADVVSFTFTSPLVKPTSRSRFSTPTNGTLCCFDTHIQKKDQVANEELFSRDMSVLSGDTLSILLEQKLKELTTRVEPVPSSLQGSISDHETIGTKILEKDKVGNIFRCGISSTNGEVHGMSKLQEVEDYSSNSDARNEQNYPRTSPFSVLEASFSSETHNLTENSDTANGIKLSSSSIQARNNNTCSSVTKSSSLETETELSDSATSALTEISHHSESSHSEDLEFVKDIVAHTKSVLTGHKPKDDALLFNKLDNRKLLFDSVNECMDLKCSKYFKCGYQARLKGEAIIENHEFLAKEIYGEISEWKKSMGDWDVDKLVDRDMSSQLGKWVDYDIEAFEAGVEIEKEMLDSLVEELIVDCFRTCKRMQALNWLCCEELVRTVELYTAN